MYKGTTPTYTLTFSDENLDFGDANDIAVTIADTKKQPLLELSGTDLTVEEKTITFSLTQEQTLALPNGNLFVQVNWTYDQGVVTKRACSDQVSIDFKNNLKNEVM